MLIPKKVKYRKWNKGRRRNLGIATRNIEIGFGQYGLKTLEHGRLTSRQIEAARRAMTRYIKRGGKVWIKIFPDRPITKKGAEVPMGKGKGAPDHFVAVVKPGNILFEMEGVDEAIARRAMELAAYKLPVKTRFVTK